MFKRLILVSTAVLCLTVIGDRGTAQSPQADVAHGESMNRSGTRHQHKIMEIPIGQPIPSVKLVVHKDPLRGYNLEVQVSHFRFAPQEVSQAARAGEGHGHLYVNGDKITRLYGSWYYLENLKPGKNEITVSLNSNNHATLAHDGKIIQDTEVVEVPVLEKVKSEEW